MTRSPLPSPEEVGRRLDEIEARANAATPGPWKVGSWRDNIFSVAGNKWSQICRVKRNDDEATDDNPDVTDAAFIAGAREDIPWLISELRKATAAIQSERARAEQMERALEPLAVLQIPSRPQGNAGAYSIRFADIERAKALLTAREAPVA